MEINRKNLHTILWLIVFGTVFYTAIQHLEMTYLISVMKPFLLGAGIAFVLNVPMRAIERCLAVPKSKMPPALRRIISLLLTFALFVGVVLIVCLMIVPEIGRSARTLGGYLSNF